MSLNLVVTSAYAAGFAWRRADYGRSASVGAGQLTLSAVSPAVLAVSGFLGGKLAYRGFEPERATSALLLLRNCPFHPLAAKAPDLVCGINHRFVGGYLDGLGAADAAAAVLQPEADTCCVRLCAPGGAEDQGEAE
jgi:hypothetical protein